MCVCACEETAGRRKGVMMGWGDRLGNGGFNDPVCSAVSEPAACLRDLKEMFPWGNLLRWELAHTADAAVMLVSAQDGLARDLTVLKQCCMVCACDFAVFCIILSDRYMEMERKFSQGWNGAFKGFSFQNASRQGYANLFR